MFILIWIKFNQYSLRTRLLAGLSVVFILLIIISSVLFRLFYFDDLTHYTSKNTKIYFQLDLRDTPDNFYKIKLVDTLLTQYHLSELDRHLINSQLAVICDESGQDLNCGLLIKSNKNFKIIEYLKQKKISFKDLRSNTIIISDNSSWLNNIKRSHNPFIYFKYQSAIYRYDALTLAVNQPKILTNEISKGLYFNNLSKTAKFKGEITPAGLILLPKKFDNIFFAHNDEKSDKESANCDININSETGADSKLALLMPILSQSYNLCLNKINSTGNIYNDYEFTIISDQLPDSAEKIAQLEKYLLNLAALIQPKQKNYYLKDGTRILEFVSNNNNLAFISATSSRSIPLLSGNNLFYYEAKGKLIISNQKFDSIKINSFESNDNYAIIKINALPAGQIKNILSEFSYLIINDDQITIK